MPTSKESRRNFLALAGKVAIMTPPALALLLATNDRAYAGATSGQIDAIKELFVLSAEEDRAGGRLHVRDAHIIYDVDVVIDRHLGTPVPIPPFGTP